MKKKPVILKVVNFDTFGYFCSNCGKASKNTNLIEGKNGVYGNECLKEIAGEKYSKTYEMKTLHTKCWIDNKELLHNLGFINAKQFKDRKYNHYEHLAKLSKHEFESGLPQLFDNGSKQRRRPKQSFWQILKNDPLIKFLKKI